MTSTSDRAASRTTGGDVNAVRRAYERLAPRYDHIWSRYLERTIALTLAHIHLGAGSRLLDVGCGTGLLLDRLSRSQQNADLVGADVTRGMLAQAQARLGKRASLVLADASMLPVSDGAFDVVVSSSVLHHLRDSASALAEWRRVLRPHGTLVVTDWCRDFATIRALDLVLGGVDRAHARTWHTAELHQALADAGFVEIGTVRHRQGWFWGMVVATATTGSETPSASDRGVANCR